MVLNRGRASLTHADIAKDVFEFVVDGPELESTWAAFHVEELPPGPAVPARAEADAEVTVISDEDE